MEEGLAGRGGLAQALVAVSEDSPGASGIGFVCQQFVVRGAHLSLVIEFHDALLMALILAYQKIFFYSFPFRPCFLLKIR
jgi:hypothetical protein